MSRLKSAGVITGVVAHIDKVKVGLPITVVTTIRFERDGHEHTHRLIDQLRSRPEVTILHVLAGQHDLLVVTVVGNLDHYTTGVLADLEADGNVSRLETHVSLGELKFTHAVPL